MKKNAEYARKKKTQHHQAHPNAGGSFHPRSLFRGLTVPYNTAPGQKYLHPERRRNDVARQSD